MAAITHSQFAKYDMTADEELGASVLTTDTKQFIQNLLTNVAEQRLALVPDPNNYSLFIQQEAHFKGQMAAYQYLLDCSDASQTALLEKARIEASGNRN